MSEIFTSRVTWSWIWGSQVACKKQKKKKEKTHGPSIVKKSSTFKDATIKQKRQ